MSKAGDTVEFSVGEDAVHTHQEQANLGSALKHVFRHAVMSPARSFLILEVLDVRQKATADIVAGNTGMSKLGL